MPSRRTAVRASLSALAVVTLLLGCASSKRRELEPLESRSWRIELPVPGFAAASVALPLGATVARPVAVVLHGARDRADWQCGSFRGVLGGKLFILCPRGEPSEVAERFSFRSVDAAAQELRAALSALKTHYGAHVAPGPVMLVGYDEGAFTAVELARQEPSFFSRVMLVKGDPAAFSPSSAAIFAARGGKRVLFFCTEPECDDRAVSRALLLSRAGAQAKSVKHDVGPYLDARFTERLRGELPWLLEGDSRFSR